MLDWAGRLGPRLVCYVGLGLAVVKASASSIAAWSQHLLAARFGDHVRARVAKRLLDRGATGGPAETHASIVIRLAEIERAVDDGLLSGIRASLSLIPLVAAMVALSTSLAVFASLALVPFALLLSLVRRRLRARHAAATALAEELHTGLDELIRQADVWRTYGAGPRVRSSLMRLGDRAGRALAAAHGLRTFLSGANEVLGVLALLALVVLAPVVGLPGGVRDVAPFVAVVFLAYRPLRDLGDARVQLDRGASAWRALEDDPALERDDGAHVSSETRVAEPPSGETRADAAPAARTWSLAPLELRRLRPADPDRAAAVVWGRGLSLRVEPGELVAVVGPTGAGKSTLLRCLLGLEPARGAVRWGDADVSDAGVGPDPRPFAWVPQESAIVSGSLVENVALGAVSRHAAEDALRSVGAGALLARRGDERLAAGGALLSGGERQWVALARALATGQPALLLDEPTAGLDETAERQVLSALASLKGRRTIVVVTHRRSPLALADRVFHLADDGSTRAEGGSAADAA